MNTSARDLARRINANAVASLIALILACAGIVMIFMEISDHVFIDLKSALVSGHVRSGLVGMALILCSVVISVSSIMRTKPHHRIVISKDNNRIEWEGTLSTIDELDSIERMVERHLEGRR